MDELLRMRGIEKSFPGVKALSGVDLDLRKGELLALVGENGAGKSTLMKILAGVYNRDAGEIIIGGKQVEMLTPRVAENLGISIMYQEFNLFSDLTVAENIFISREPRILGAPFVIDDRKLRTMTLELLSELNLDINPDTKVRTLSVAEQQMVEIAKALSMNAEILVMDEPTAALTESETESLFRVIKNLKKKGVGIIYISHRLEELEEICDRVTVLRDGGYVFTRDYKDISMEEIIEAMVGRSLEDKFPPYACYRRTEKAPILKVNSITRQDGICVEGLELFQGEILGIYGLMGSGRTEFARSLFGADKSVCFDVEMFGVPMKVGSPVDAIRHGLGYLTEDRKKDGLALGLSVEYNINLPNLNQITKLGVVNEKEARRISDEYIRDIRIKTPSCAQVAMNLSGGNQQKVIIAKWLRKNSKIIIFDEPTRGIDVGAKFEVYELMQTLAREGVGVIMISSELPEIIGMSNRVLVMKDGRLSGELQRSELQQERILSYAI